MLCPSTTVPIIKITLPLPQSDSIHPTAVLLQGLGPNPSKEDERTQHGQGNFKELSWGRHSPDGFSRFVIKLQQLRPCGFNAETGKQPRETRKQTHGPTETASDTRRARHAADTAGYPSRDSQRNLCLSPHSKHKFHNEGSECEK